MGVNPDDIRSWHEALPKSERDAVAKASKAWLAIESDGPFENWMLIADALTIGRRLIMHELQLNEPKGRGYNEAFAQWCKDHRFETIETSTRSRLLFLAHPPNRAMMEKLRAGMTPSERLRINHPVTMYNRMRKVQHPVHDKGKKPKVSAVVQELQQDNARLRGALDRLVKLNRLRVDRNATPHEEATALRKIREILDRISL